MKSVCFLILLFSLIPRTSSYAFEISGLQPVAPNGIFSTFSAESLPKNKVSFELGLERSREPDFYRFTLKGAYGISDSMEFGVTLPYVYKFSESVDGMEDVAIGVKHRFYDEQKIGPSIAYLLNASFDTGNKVFSTNGRFGAGLIISKRVGPFSGHMNIFYELPGTRRLKDEISFSAGIEFAAAHNFKMLGEILARKSYDSHGYDHIEARFGYRIKTTESIYTTLGAGLDIKNRTPEYRFMISLSYTSPQEKKEIKKIIEEE